MKIHILATGSKGNCAIIEENNAKLMIDCGIDFKDIITNENFGDFNDYQALLITHNHKDHSKARKDMDLSGLKIIDTDYEQVPIIINKKFAIVPYEVKHDCKCYGYIINSLKNTKVVWQTDYSDCPIIQGADVYCIEINYDNETMSDIIFNANNDFNTAYINKIKNTHNSLESAIAYFSQLKTKPKYIIVLHSNKKHLNYEKTLQKLGKFCENVFIASKNSSFEINF